jgi:hypothetical protein
MTQLQGQKQFVADFEKKVSDTVESMELACLKADKDTYNALDLHIPLGCIELWGLIVFCSRRMYFYVPPSENYMTALMRQAAHENAPSEQLLDLSAFSDFKTFIPLRKWYSFLFSESAHRIDASFIHDGIRRSVVFSTHSKAADIQRKIQEKIK